MSSKTPVRKPQSAEWPNGAYCACQIFVLDDDDDNEDDHDPQTPSPSELERLLKL